MNFIDILGFVVVYRNLHLKLHHQIDHQLYFVIINYMLFNNNKMHQMEIQVSPVAERIAVQVVLMAFMEVIINSS